MPGAAKMPSGWRLALLSGACVLLMDASPAPAAVVAEITRPRGGEQEITIQRVEPQAVVSEVPGGYGELRLPLSEIQSLRLVPPDDWHAASILIGEGKFDEALPALGAYAEAVAPVLIIPESDAHRYFFAYPELLSALDRHEEALAFLENVPEDSEPANLARKIIMAAYCLAQTGQPDAARETLELMAEPGFQNPLFNRYQITAALIANGLRDHADAINRLAQVAALRRPGTDGYDEALFLAAKTYEALADAIEEYHRQLEGDERLARQAEQDWESAIAASGVIASDSPSAAAIMHSGADYRETAHGVYRHLLRLFPESPHAALARAALPKNVMPDEEDAPAEDAETPAAAEPKPTPIVVEQIDDGTL